MGFLVLLNSFYGNIHDITIIDIVVVLIAGIIAAIFKFKGYIFTGVFIAFWYAVYEQVSKMGELDSFLALYMNNEELYNYLSPTILAFGILIGFGLGLLVNMYKGFDYINDKLRPEFTFKGGTSAGSLSGYSGGNYQNYYSDDNPDENVGYSSYENNDNDDSDFGGSSGSDSGSGGSSERTDTWGMNQKQIDYHADIRDYGKPDWQADKEREEREYGLPSYAREKD